MTPVFVTVNGIGYGLDGSVCPAASTIMRGKKVTMAETNPTVAGIPPAAANNAFQCFFHHGGVTACCSSGWRSGGVFGPFGGFRPRDLSIHDSVPKFSYL